MPAKLLARPFIQLVPIGKALAALDLRVRVKVLDELVHKPDAGNLVPDRLGVPPGARTTTSTNICSYCALFQIASNQNMLACICRFWIRKRMWRVLAHSVGVASALARAIRSEVGEYAILQLGLFLVYPRLVSQAVIPSIDQLLQSNSNSM
jgi:hypothetical protein